METAKWKGKPVVVQYSIFDYMALLDRLDKVLPQPLKKDLDLPVQTAPKLKKKASLSSNWTEEEIKLLHSALLEESLRSLKQANGNLKTKAEVMRWIKKPIVDNPEPFSFQACCLYEQVNPETMQENILQIVERNNMLH